MKIIAIAACAAVTGCVLAQGGLGPLDPPAGPVLDTGPDLAALARAVKTPISGLPGAATAKHVITEPGAYVLDTDLIAIDGESGIWIAAPGNVFIDLGGHTISQAGTGHIEGFGGHGVHAESDPELLILGDLNSYENAGDGFRVGEDVFGLYIAAVGNAGAGVRGGNDVVIKGSKIKENLTAALLLGSDAQLFDNFVKGRVDGGVYMVGARNTFVLNTDDGDWFLTNGMMTNLTHNRFTLKGDTPPTAPVIRLSGENLEFSSNHMNSAMASAQSPGAQVFAEVGGDNSNVEGNTFQGLMANQVGLALAGSGHIVHGNTFVAAPVFSGAPIGVHLRPGANRIAIVGNTFKGFFVGSAVSNGTGNNNVLAPIVDASALPGNGNPDRNLVLP
ncbi:MAG: hypothetical protein AAFR38_11110 [Planctomycetota bacterium]